MKRVPIKFINHYKNYMKGEVAGFDEDQANALITAGYAIVISPVIQEDANRLRKLGRVVTSKHLLGPDETKDVKGPKKTKSK